MLSHSSKALQGASCGSLSSSAASSSPSGPYPSTSSSTQHTPQSNLVKTKRRRKHRPRRSPDASSPQQAMFTSAQDVAIERSTFNTAGHGSVIVNVTSHLISSSRPESENDRISSQPPSVATLASDPPDASFEPNVNCLETHAVVSIPDGSDCSSPRIYQEQLLSKKRGTPLWLPGPNQNLPQAYRLRGLCIGDVGTLNDLGGFSFLFNIFEEAHSKINRGKVPKGFKPLTWESEEANCDKNLGIGGVDVSDIEKHKIYGAGSWLASETVEATFDSKVSGGLTFQTYASEGAILAMPRGATSHDLDDHLLEDYMSANLEDWYIYASRKRRLKIKNGDIRLVYGCDKVSSWGIATFHRESVFGTVYPSKQKTMRFRPTGSADCSDPVSFAWNHIDGGDGRVGPSDEDMKGLTPHPHGAANLGWPNSPGSDAIENQCVFVRTFNAKLSPNNWNKIMVNDTSDFAGDETSGGRYHDNTFGGGGGRTSQEEGHSSSTSSSNTSSGSSSQGSSVSNIQYMAMEGQPLSFSHPAETLNDSLLRLYPQARMAITTDGDWLSVLDRLNGSTDTTKLLKLGIHSLHFKRLMHQSHEIVNAEGIIRIRGHTASTTSHPSKTSQKRLANRTMLRPHSEYYMRDGDLRIIAETTLFKIHRKMIPESAMWKFVKKRRRDVIVTGMLAVDVAALAAEYYVPSILGREKNYPASHSAFAIHLTHAALYDAPEQAELESNGIPRPSFDTAAPDIGQHTRSTFSALPVPELLGSTAKPLPDISQQVFRCDQDQNPMENPFTSQGQCPLPNSLPVSGLGPSDPVSSAPVLSEPTRHGSYKNRLFLGDIKTARSTRYLNENRITHILSVCSDQIPAELPEADISHMRIEVEDVEYADLLIRLPGACRFIDGALKTGGVVLVHCQQGYSRSATVVAAYLMWSRRINVNRVMDKVRGVKMVQGGEMVQGAPDYIWINPGFQEQLVLFELCQYNPSPNNGIYVNWRAHLDRRLREAGIH